MTVPSERKNMTQGATGATATASPERRKPQRNPNRCLECIKKRSECVPHEGRKPPCERCWKRGLECVPQGPVGSAAAEESLPQNTIIATSEQQSMTGRATRVTAPAGQESLPQMTMRATATRENMPQRIEGSTQPSLRQDTMDAASTPEDVPQRATLATANACDSSETGPSEADSCGSDSDSVKQESRKARYFTSFSQPPKIWQSCSYRECPKRSA
jgi:hypothetical protein